MSVIGRSILVSSLVSPGDGMANGRSRRRRPEGGLDLRDGRSFRVAHGLTALPVRGGHPFCQAEHEAPVVVYLFGRCLLLEQLDRLAQPPQGLVLQLVRGPPAT